MTERIPGRPRAIDCAAALVLAAWAVSQHGSRPVIGVPAALAMTVPLAWRSRAPLVCAVVVAAGFALQGAQPDPPESLATLIAFLLAAYSVAATADARTTALGAGALLAAGLGETALAGDNDFAFISVLLAVAVVAGWAIGSRTRSAELDREREAAAAVQAERERIARELHDSVAHAVSLMVVQAGAAETVAHDPDAPEAAALRRIRETGRDAVADLGRMVGLLRADGEASDTVPGIGDAPRLIESFGAAGLEVDLRIAGEERPLPGGLDQAAYRIAQEALTNALKHGEGNAATLVVAYEPAAVRITVRNRAGTGTWSNGTGHGLIGMQERARLYGGELQTRRVGEDTFEIEARLPLPA